MRLGERRQGGHGMQMLGRQGRKGPSAQRAGREAVRGHADPQRLENGAESRWGGRGGEDSEHWGAVLGRSGSCCGNETEP